MDVVQLWRYPVKSMRGEQVSAADVDERGLRGDRAWAVLDLDTGLSLTARRCPDLLFARARYREDRDDVEIELPDGHTDLSTWLGHDVKLVRAGTGTQGRYEIAADFEAEDDSEWFSWDGPSATFHDNPKTQVSVLSTGSMGSWAWPRFRANVIVEGGGEVELVGRTVRVGSVEATVPKAISRCVMVTRPQPGGVERDLDVLRTVNRERAGNLGIGLVVSSPGRVAVGDSLIPQP